MAGTNVLVAGVLASPATGLIAKAVGALPLLVFVKATLQRFQKPPMPGFVAGAMLFVISDEIISETRARGSSGARPLG